jgi:hypothetical protein
MEQSNVASMDRHLLSTAGGMLLITAMLLGRCF